ncbi:MAG: VOC family protein [Desulfosarcina sp.]
MKWMLPETYGFNGRPVRYGISGNGPPVVVVHGTPWSSFNLRHQKALFDADIPLTVFLTNDIQTEYARLRERGVAFRGEPKDLGPSTAVLFEDTCGNLINLVQLK